MAGLPPDGEWLVHLISEWVIVYHRYTEEEIVRFDPYDGDATAKAQSTIHESDKLSDEQKCFAHFWSGYFHACAVKGM